MMKTELVDVSPTRKEIKIEIEPAAVRESFDRISDRYSKQASVPGFGVGMLPARWCEPDLREKYAVRSYANSCLTQ